MNWRDGRAMLWFVVYFITSVTALFYGFRAMEDYYRNPPLNPADVPWIAWLHMVLIAVGWWHIGVWFMGKVMGKENSPPD